MSGLSTKKGRTSLRALEQRRGRLLGLFRRDEELAVGTVSEVRARCGKPGCRCARGKGHPQMRLLYAQDGKRRCKLVRKDDEERIRTAGERYRQLKRALQQLGTLNSKEMRLLRKLIRRRAINYM